MEEDGRAEKAPLLIVPKRATNVRIFARSVSLADDELHSFRSWLRWMCVDQSGPWRTILSWSMFFLLAIAVPFTSHFIIVVDSDREGRRRHASYGAVVQLSLTSVAAVSFLCLSAFVRLYGLRRFLFLDKLCRENETVRQGYTYQLNRSFKLLSMFVLPSFLAECGYKIWWYCTGEGRISFLGNPYLSDAVACILELWSWLYRLSIFFLVCVLLRLMCHLQILRLQDFCRVFQQESDVETILSEHLRIRRHLRVISHRFRSFILACLIIITLSQLASLLVTTRPNAEVNFYNAGELAPSLERAYKRFKKKFSGYLPVGSSSRWFLPLYAMFIIPTEITSLCLYLFGLAKFIPPAAPLPPLGFNETSFLRASISLSLSSLCSVGLLTGMLICLRSATKITHKAQSITSQAAKWHAFATIESFEAELEATPRISPASTYPLGYLSESDETGDGDGDDLNDIKAAVTTISFQKRQALVTYLENNRAGITVYGFMLDRSWLHMIFCIELPLVLWLLGKTIGFS